MNHDKALPVGSLFPQGRVGLLQVVKDSRPFGLGSSDKPSRYAPGFGVVNVHERQSVAKKVVRDAGTGKFVPKKEAERRPTETVTETVPVRKPTKKT